MKKLIKFLIYFFSIAIIAVALLLTYVKAVLPSVGKAPELKVNPSPEIIERGRYLANHVMVCMDCHSTRDWSLFSGPPVRGTEGAGGEIFNQELGFPGKYVASNITPYNLGKWTDGEIFRAITSGETKDGRALFPIMPYHNFGKLDKGDIEAVIAYLRNLKPIEKGTEKSSSDFPMNFIINTMPKKAEFTTIPPASDIINYGKYLITASSCIDCHTKQDKGKLVGEHFAGGNEFKFPDGSVLRSTNITPDNNTGIGSWSKEKFIERFKIYTDSSFSLPKIKQGEMQTIMPWTMYAGMKTEDISAIYAYLQSVKPVTNAVIKFTPQKK
ncbi:MAG: c-type cytochrome [Sphingobacteriales bacterium]|jgi:mono/diheme cytochrome c family protein|nr:c-type cytochrome [Sphingobacteriales bacterium]